MPDRSDDYYALLGIQHDADGGEVRRAWRRLALRWHPDRAGPNATAIFQRIAAAYVVLSDPSERAAYDRRRGVRATPSRPSGSAATSRSNPPPTASAAPAPPARRRAPAVMLSRLTGSLGMLLACGIARRAEEGIFELFLEPEEIAQGGMITISMRVSTRCAECGGNGCGRCATKGVVEELFSAWLAVPPDVEEGTLLAPSTDLPRMVRPVSFRVRRREA